MTICNQANGNLHYLAVAETEPAGKPLAECARVPVLLRLTAPEDLRAMKGSLAEMRRNRIRRLANDAIEQGGVLTLEELALLLTSSLSTIARDVRRLERQGLAVPTRGRNKDIGRSVEGRIQIVRMFLAGEKPEEIAAKTGRSLEDVRRPIEQFLKAEELLRNKMPAEKTAQLLHISPRLVEAFREMINGQASGS